MMKRYKARLKAIAEEYGVAEEDADRIAQAQDELAKCAECDKLENCQWTFPEDRGFQPVIAVEDNRPVIRYRICNQVKLARLKYFKEKFPARLRNKTFADYEVTADNRRAVEIAKHMGEVDKGAFFYGNVGTGKSLLAAIIAQSFLEAGKSVIFKDTPELLRELKATFGDPKLDFDSVMKSFCEVDLLILDDLGSEKPTDWAVEQIYSIINARYNAGKKLIVTSNYGGENLRERLNVGGVMGDRIISRLKEMCIGAFLGGKDRRG